MAIHVRVAGKLKWLHLRFQNLIHHFYCTLFGCHKIHGHLWLTNITRKAREMISPGQKTPSQKNENKIKLE